MSDTTVLVISLVVLAILLGLAIYIVRGRRKQQSGKAEYQWKPEQDYDVIQTGGANMTPPFPVLKKRKKPSDMQD